VKRSLNRRREKGRKRDAISEKKKDKEDNKEEGLKVIHAKREGREI
jgi:hypothetical protein